MDNNANNDTNNHATENMFAAMVVIAAFYVKFRPAIEQFRLDMMERLHNPLFVLLLIFFVVFMWKLIFEVGHHVEKLFNKVKMWQSGIKPDDKEQCMAFPFINFDSRKQVDVFRQDQNNKDRTFIGLDAQAKNKTMISIPDLRRSDHLQVLGMTGTGKTSGVFLPLVYQDALKKRPVIIIDAKGEMSTINKLYGLLKSIGREKDFMLFSLYKTENSCTYNPLYVGECEPQIVIDAFMNNFESENTYYRDTAGQIFEYAFYILHSLGKLFTVTDIFTYLNDEACQQYINRQIKQGNKMGVEQLRKLAGLLDSLADKEGKWEHVITGLNNYLSAHSEDVLNDPDSDIVLTDVIRERKIVYFQLPTNAFPIRARNVARMIQANLRYISSLIQLDQIPKDILVSVIIDEYASFAEESFVEVLNKARSSGMMVTLAHQSLSDLRRISEDFMKCIDENTMNKIYLKQTDPMLCELIAKSMGTYIKQEKTFRMSGGHFGNQVHSGESSNKMVNEFYFPPDKVKNLHRFGQGYLIYRGDNSHRCVNLGGFEGLKEVPYQKTAKESKQDGYGLYQRFYRETNANIPLQSGLKKRKRDFKESIQY